MIKAIEAGADVIDTALSPLAHGHLPSGHRVHGGRPQGHGVRHGARPGGAQRADANISAPCGQNIWKAACSTPKCSSVDTNALIYQVPGGMLSNLVSQLKQAGKEDKLEEVLQEVPRVREDAGYPPLVTPTSQIVGTQAVFNVIGGERYKMVTKEFKGLVRGEYGRDPGADRAGVREEDHRRRRRPSPAVPPTCSSPSWIRCVPRCAEWYMSRRRTC